MSDRPKPIFETPAPFSFHGCIGPVEVFGVPIERIDPSEPARPEQRIRPDAAGAA